MSQKSSPPTANTAEMDEQVAKCLGIHRVVDAMSRPSRRAYMRAVFKSVRPADIQHFDKMRGVAANDAAKQCKSDGHSRVGKAYFEFLTDKKLWNRWIPNNEEPKFPWDKEEENFNVADFRSGASDVYQRWLEKNPFEPKPVVEKKEDVEVGKQPGDEAVVKDTTKPKPAGWDELVAESESQEGESSTSLAATEEKEDKGKEVASSAASLSDEISEVPSSAGSEIEDPTTLSQSSSHALSQAQGLETSIWAGEIGPSSSGVVSAVGGPSPMMLATCGMAPPPVPDRAAREHVWNAVIDNDWRMGPVCGPFEIRLPRYLDFQYFVLGPNGAGLAEINNDLIHESLVISWANTDPSKQGELMEPVRPDRLIVGFSPKAGKDAANRLPDQHLLYDLWNTVTRWMMTVFDGRPSALFWYLRMVTKFRFGRAAAEDEAFLYGGPLHSAWQRSEAAGPHLDEALQRWAWYHFNAQKVVENALKDDNPDAMLEGWVLCSENHLEAMDRVELIQQIWLHASEPASATIPLEWCKTMRTAIIEGRYKF